MPGVRVTLVDGQGQEQVAESDGGGRVQVDGLVGSFVRLMAARQGRQELALMLDTGTPQSVGGFLFPITQGQEHVYDLTASGGTLAIHDMLLKMPATPAPTIEVAATVEAFTQENAEAVLRDFLTALHEGRYEEAVRVHN